MLAILCAPSGMTIELDVESVLVQRQSKQSIKSGLRRRVTLPAMKLPLDEDEPSTTLRWRQQRRTHALEILVDRANRLRWSSPLLRLLLEEMWVGEEFETLLGPPRALDWSRYPQAIAVAIILRHSWRRDDLRRTARRLGLSRRGL